MIPRRIHLWWHTTPPDAIVEAAGLWADAHPEWDVHLWGDEDDVALAIAQAKANEGCVLAADRIRHRSNLVRWHLLYDLGGVWVDCDTEPLHPLDDLVDDDRPFCGRIAVTEATIIGGPAGHDLFAEMATAAAQPRTGLHVAPLVSGAYVLDRIVGHHDVRVLEPGAFFDIDARGRPIRAPRHSPRYARHRWQSSAR